MDQEDRLMCDVPNCDQPMFCGWTFQYLDGYKRICFYHIKREHNKKDKFDLMIVFGMKRYVGVKFDRLSCPIPPDAGEFERESRNYAEERKQKSIARLRAWKDGVRPPPPKKLNEQRDWTRKRAPEMDDIVGGILNGG